MTIAGRPGRVSGHREDSGLAGNCRNPTVLPGKGAADEPVEIVAGSFVCCDSVMLSLRELGFLVGSCVRVRAHACAHTHLGVLVGMYGMSIVWSE